MSDTALLVVDMLNTYEHADADKLIPSVEQIIDPLTTLVFQARKRDDVDLVYVNDNYGDFTADHNDLARAALDGGRPDLVEPIAPDADERFLMKVRHSAFYSTPLGYLLGQLKIKRVIITGQVTEQCILYSALDAHVRHFPVVVPPDGVAHIDSQLADAALAMMDRNMSAEIIDADKCLGGSR